MLRYLQRRGGLLVDMKLEISSSLPGAKQATSSIVEWVGGGLGAQLFVFVSALRKLMISTRTHST